MLNSLLGALESGLLYALMALGVYITFRILDFPDLTVDGSFTTGGAIAAVMITGEARRGSPRSRLSLAAWPLGPSPASSIPKDGLTDCCPGF